MTIGDGSAAIGMPSEDDIIPHKIIRVDMDAFDASSSSVIDRTFVEGP